MCRIVTAVQLPTIITEDIRTNYSILFNIASVIADIYNVRMQDVFSKSRKQEVIEAKRMFFYYTKENSKYSYTRIGAFLNRDHATAMYHHKKIEEWLKMKHYQNYYISILQQINSLL